MTHQQQQQNILAAAAWLYENDKIKNRFVDQRVGQILEKERISQADMEILEIAVSGEQNEEEEPCR